DIGGTISHFYQKSQKVDAFLEKLSKLTKEEDQIGHFSNILKHLTADDLKTIIRLIKHDLRMGAGAKHILEGIHPDAYSVYKRRKTWMMFRKLNSPQCRDQHFNTSISNVDRGLQICGTCHEEMS
ncbi:hypothetical protein HUJ04_011160, partial [Dendroctonus ponderosae]